jgi:hypothetical protein
MARPLDTRLDRVEGRRTAASVKRGSTATRRRHIWRAEAAMGAIIRDALARAGVDAAGATRLRLADDAAVSLAALPDTPELQRADGEDKPPADGEEKAPADADDPDPAGADAFAAKIAALVHGFAGAPPPDFANASFAELLAWALAQPAAE